MRSDLTIWCNANLPDDALAELRAGIGKSKLILAGGDKVNNLTAGGIDSTLEHADIAFGQPDPGQIISLQKLKWVHLTSAGYTRYDRDDIRTVMKSRHATMSNSSLVFQEPCAEHVLAMMMSFARQLPMSHDEQRSSRAWSIENIRRNSHLLLGQTALILSYGAIAQRLVELLSPFRMNLIAVRRTPTGKEPIRVEPFTKTDELLPLADHVINILPAAEGTDRFMNASRFAKMKAGAIFYNVGRGSTVDQPALLAALQSKHLAGAYLDVTDPEPLPADHPLWDAPNCYITPHTAGGHADEFSRLVKHFLANLDRYASGESLLDRII